MAIHAKSPSRATMDANAPPLSHSHGLSLLWCGFVVEGDELWCALSQVSQDFQNLFQLLHELCNVDCNPLWGFDVQWWERTAICPDRVKMATAALMHFEGDAGALACWMGGVHWGWHCNILAMLNFFQDEVDWDVFDECVHVLEDGIPKYCNAEALEANFQAFWKYGNHSSVVSISSWRHLDVELFQQTRNRQGKFKWCTQYCSLLPGASVRFLCLECLCQTQDGSLKESFPFSFSSKSNKPKARSSGKAQLLFPPAAVSHLSHRWGTARCSFRFAPWQPTVRVLMVPWLCSTYSRLSVNHLLARLAPTSPAGHGRFFFRR